MIQCWKDKFLILSLLFNILQRQLAYAYFTFGRIFLFLHHHFEVCHRKQQIITEIFKDILNLRLDQLIILIIHLLIKIKMLHLCHSRIETLIILQLSIHAEMVQTIRCFCRPFDLLKRLSSYLLLRHDKVKIFLFLQCTDSNIFISFISDLFEFMLVFMVE